MRACDKSMFIWLVVRLLVYPLIYLSSLLQVPDYFDIIKRPIALSTIREKVNNCEYKTASKLIFCFYLNKHKLRLEPFPCILDYIYQHEKLILCGHGSAHQFWNDFWSSFSPSYLTAEYIEDVELMFANCLQYNPRHTNEAKAGARLQAFFNSEVSNLGLADRTTPPQKRPRM